jgi:predicted ATPase
MRGDIRMNGHTFGERVQEYLRGSGYSQQNLAGMLGLHAGVLNRKLRGSGQAHITQLEVGHIIKTLAQWNIITTRDEALQLLELANLKQMSLSLKEWQEPPLNQLAREAQSATHSTISRPVTFPDLQHNIPAPVTRLIGREWAVERLQHLLRRNEVRLITLVGPGGSGKTRLALHVAEDLIPAFAQGTWLVSLAGVSDAAQVPTSIVQALGLTPSPGVLPIHTLITYLRDKQLLLVLDNFEQVEEAAPILSELLAAAHGLKILVTSRMVLHLYGEHQFIVPPLDVPHLNTLSNTRLLSEYSAIQLFLERVQAVMPDVVLTSKNGAIIAQICAMLDGLPLALELAAARIKMLSPEQLLERLLEARLPMLVGGARNLPRKLQTLRNTFEWSFDLLSPAQQQSFARLGVFSGGWSLEAAAAMMQYWGAVGEVTHSKETTSGANKSVSISILDMLGFLVDNSLLIRRQMARGQMRFTMLETLHEYVLERLAAQGEYDQLKNWHAFYYLELAENAEADLRARSQPTWPSELVAEQENFRAALLWSLQRATADMMLSDHIASKEAKEGASNEAIAAGKIIANVQLSAIELLLRLAAALYPYWEWQGSISEGHKWLDAALKIPLSDEPGSSILAARAKALCAPSRFVK